MIPICRGEGYKKKHHLLLNYASSFPTPTSPILCSTLVYKPAKPSSWPRKKKITKQSGSKTQTLSPNSVGLLLVPLSHLHWLQNLVPISPMLVLPFCSPSVVLYQYWLNSPLQFWGLPLTSDKVSHLAPCLVF